MKFNQRLLALAGTALACVGAAAATTDEVEPNNTAATAQMVANDGTVQIAGQRSFADPSDDFFSFTVGASGLLHITSFSPEAIADSVMGLYGPTGVLLASSDDGPGLGSLMSGLSHSVPIGQTGLYTLGFSGFNPGLLACTDTVPDCYDTSGDFVFDTFVAGGGAGGSTGWSYTIHIEGAALVPEPAALALFALGLPLLLGWQRRGRR